MDDNPLKHNAFIKQSKLFAWLKNSPSNTVRTYI